MNYPHPDSHAMGILLLLVLVLRGSLSRCCQCGGETGDCSSSFQQNNGLAQPLKMRNLPPFCGMPDPERLLRLKQDDRCRYSRYWDCTKINIGTGSVQPTTQPERTPASDNSLGCVALVQRLQLRSFSSGSWLLEQS
eukprot:846367-Rhodomonas_salina.3